jgi:large subunit ribosomal protein L15
MNLNNLKPAERATKSSKRIGRGQGSGKGATSTRGHKGAQSRSGYSRKIGFEGGQMPIYRILPKRGFKNINRIEYSAINLSTLQMLVDKTKTTEITLELLRENGLIAKKDLVKVLGNGELTTKINITVHNVSKSAKEAIEKLGGTVTTLIAATPKAEEKQETVENN